MIFVGVDGCRGGYFAYSWLWNDQHFELFSFSRRLVGKQFLKRLGDILDALAAAITAKIEQSADFSIYTASLEKTLKG